jgi:carboxypeptidase D
MPETLALMNWTLEHNFVAGVSMHEGAVVANYPWDGSLDRQTHYSACPDDRAYQYLAKIYAGRNPEMRDSREFPGGITNGAHWYPLWGGMQDWNYIAAGCFELTLELSQGKWPNASLLRGIWENNQWAIANFTLAATYGSAWGTVKGVSEVNRNRAARPIGGARVRVEGIAKHLKSGPLGDFYRPLAPGKYVVTAEADGYEVSSNSRSSIYVTGTAAKKEKSTALENSSCSSNSARSCKQQQQH